VGAYAPPLSSSASSGPSRKVELPRGRPGGLGGRGGRRDESTTYPPAEQFCTRRTAAMHATTIVARHRKKPCIKPCIVRPLMLRYQNLGAEGALEVVEA
jgi:hypothetical protein